MNPFGTPLFARLRGWIDAPAHRPPRPGKWLKEIFSSAHYLSQFADDETGRAAASSYPVAHYFSEGWHQGKNPHPLFDVNWYLETNADVAAAGLEPFSHYLRQGWREGREPHPGFNAPRLLSTRLELLLKPPRSPLELLAHLPPAELLSETPAPAPVSLEKKWPSFYTTARPYPHASLAALHARIAAYRAAKKPGNKIVVCTCITGGYDTLRIPEELSPDVDYVAFSDKPLDGLGVFETRLIETHLIETHGQDIRRVARQVKLPIHLHLSNYQIAIWCDANVMLRAGFRRSLEPFIASGEPIAFLANPVYSCPYEEAVGCVLRNADKAETIVSTMLAYRRDGFPARSAMIEANLFACRPADDRAIAFFSEWWTRFNEGSCRDQLSASYVIWKRGTTYFPFLGKSLNTRNHPSLALLPHGTYDRAFFTGIVT